MGLKHQAEPARKWRTAIRCIQGHFPLHLPPLLFLTDPNRVPDPMGSVSRLPAECGVIYRHFGSHDRASVAQRLADLCRKQNRAFLVAADPTLALAVGAYGVHWPERRLSEARAWRSQFAIQTASAHSRRALFKAQTAGMDAALVSTVFKSKSPSASPAMGPAKLCKLARMSALPVYGLGGLSAENSARISECSGIAAIDGLLPNSD